MPPIGSGPAPVEQSASGKRVASLYQAIRTKLGEAARPSQPAAPRSKEAVLPFRVALFDIVRVPVSDWL